jgi:VanZ family protein
MAIVLKIIGYLLILSIFIFSLIPGGNGEGLFPHSDKVGHAIAYFSVTYWFSNLFPRNKHLALVIKFTLQGIFIEFLQRMTGYRTFDYLDMLANFSGCLLAYVLAAKYHRIFKNWIKPQA